MKLIIKITKEVLKESMDCGNYKVINNKSYPVLSGNSCAVAVAIRSLLPFSYAYNTTIDATYYKGSETSPILLPESARRFIIAFDELSDKPEMRLNLPEFSFDIEVPDSVIEKIGIKEATEIISKSSTLELA